MPDSKLFCPRCGTDRGFIQENGRMRCTLCEHVFAPSDCTEKNRSARRVFISYRHDRQAVVNRIADALTRLGYRVWFDKYNIRTGDDWRQAIRRGIGESNGVLAFLSRESLLRDGVCMDELRIAVGVKYGNILTVLLQKEDDLSPIPAFLTHRQWLDLHTWQEKLDAGADADKAWIQEQIDTLTRVLDSSEYREFEGAITFIRDRLHVQDTAVSKQGRYLEQLFAGREWLTREIEEWLDAEDGGRLCALYGGPGTGKSAFAAQYAYLNGRVAAAFFFEYGNPAFGSVRSMICSLSLQLACRLPVFRQNLLESLQRMDDPDGMPDEALFENVLKGPIAGCQIGGGHERLCVVIDELDECADRLGAVSRMVNEYCARLPDWLRVLVLSREEAAVTQALTPNRVIRISDHPREQTADIHAYLARRLEPLLAGRPESPAWLDRLVKNADGVFLYAEIVSGMILDGQLRPDDMDAYPQNLSTSFQAWFSRYFPDTAEFDRSFRLLLGVIAACGEPVPAEELALLNEWDLSYDESRHRFAVSPPEGLFSHREDPDTLLRRIDPLLKREKDPSGQETVAFRHRYIAEWYTGARSAVYYCSVSDVLKALVEVWHAQIGEGDLPSPFRCVHFLSFAQTAGVRGTALKRLARSEGLQEGLRRHTAEACGPEDLTPDNIRRVRENELLRAGYDEALLLRGAILYGEDAPETKALKTAIAEREQSLAARQLRSFLCLPEKSLRDYRFLASGLMKRAGVLEGGMRLALAAVTQSRDFDALFQERYLHAGAAVTARVSLPEKCVFFIRRMDETGAAGDPEPFLALPARDGRGEITLLRLVGGEGDFCLDLTSLWPDGHLRNIPDGFAYHNKRLTGLRLPEGLRAIKKDAFSGCDHISGGLLLPSSLVSIGDSAFADCTGFTGELRLPDSLSSIGDFAFVKCSGFTGILRLPHSLSSIGNGAFAKCSGFTGVLRLPHSLSSIGDKVFQYCSGFTGELRLPASLSSIGSGAFAACSGFTGELRLPASLSSIGNHAFEDCSGFTGELRLPHSLSSIGNSVFSGCSGFSGELRLPTSLSSIGDGAFMFCRGFTGELRLPDSLSSIGNHAFEGCKGFSGELHLPDSLSFVGNWAFSCCSGFTGKLCLPDSLSSIRDGTFAECSGFTGELRLPHSLSSIGENAFRDCSGFTGELHLPDSLSFIGESAFEYCSGFTGELHLPASLSSIGDFAFYACNGFTGKLRLPDVLSSIGNETFRYCSGFTGELCLPDSLSFIGNMAFWGCFGFTGKLHLPSSHISIGTDAFAGTGLITHRKQLTLESFQGLPEIPDHTVIDLSGVTDLCIPDSIVSIGNNIQWINQECLHGNLHLPDSLSSIGDHAFENCKGFTGELRLPDFLSFIGDFAFSDCSGFTGELRLSSSLSLIGDDAFAGCSGFTGELRLPPSLSSIGNEAFGSCSGFTGRLRLPASLSSIGDGGFFNCSGFTGKLCLPDSLSSIGNYTFESCRGFTGELRLPGFLSSIGDDAFAGCSGFTGELHLPASLSSIGDWAFSDCKGFTGELRLPASLSSIGERAFWNCSGFSGELNLPASVTSVGKEAFIGCSFPSVTVLNPHTVLGTDCIPPYSGILVRGHAGSTAERYAAENGMPFEALE